MAQLRKRLIRLAYEKPELREHVLPLVSKQAGTKKEWVRVDKDVRIPSYGVFEAGQYLVEMPADYDPKVVGAEDIVMDGALRVVKRKSGSASERYAAGDPKSPAMALGNVSAEIVMAVAKEVEKLLKKEGDFASIKTDPPAKGLPYRASATVEFKVEYTDGRPPQGGWIAISHGLSAGDRNPHVSSEAYFLGRQEVLQQEAPVKWEAGPKDLGGKMAKIVVDNFFRVFSG